MQFTSIYYYQGTVYINIQKQNYTPSYDFSLGQYKMIISGMGPIVVGTTLTLTMLVYINTNSNFRINAYIDSASALSTFTSPKYLYEGLV